MPLETDWTVDDLTILPARCRYELIDGRLDLWDRDSLARLAGLALMAELKAACPPGFRVLPEWHWSATGWNVRRRISRSWTRATPLSWPFPVTIDLPLVSERWRQTFEYVGPTNFEPDDR